MLLAFVLLVLILRGPLAGWMMPQAKVQSLLRQADAALAEGHLSAADGHGARQLYEAALAIDPDRPAARAGLAAVALSALQQADERLQADDVEGARQLLALARELSAPRQAEASVTRRLREHENTRAGVETLLEWAAQARAEGRLYGDSRAALPLYRRVLEQQPTRREALEGREDAIGELLQQMHEALAAGRLQRAAQLLEVARSHDPGHMDLPQAGAAFSQARSGLRAHADIALRRQRLEQAEADFRLLLQLAPEDAAARRGLDAVAQAHLLRAHARIGEQRLDDAEAAIARARGIAPQLAELRAAEEALVLARRRQAQADAGRAASPPAGAETMARVRRLLAEVEAAEAGGDVFAARGSAVEALLAARRLAPDDPRVIAAGERLLAAAGQCFDRALSRNNLGRARTCLDARAALQGESVALRQARRRLAERWVAFGEERLRAGELAAASRAAEHVAELEPATAGLEALQRRLSVAEPGLR